MWCGSLERQALLEINTVQEITTMAQGEFTKEEAAQTEVAFKEVFDALSKPKQREFLGHANDIYLFLAACKENCPNEKK